MITPAHQIPGDKFIITGVDRSGKRFKKVTDNFTYARSHNVWQGTLWLERDGKRHKILTWNN